ncbi:MAG: TonB-dependent receptor, partial [Acidobacteria bacterium]|nr:TonB-dependent receptor [Acidobacteriota bacterium]
ASAPIFAPGFYQFRTIRDLVAGAPPLLFLGTISPNIPHGMRQWISGFYVQDDWRLRPNLTVNMGLRWEPYSRPYEVKGRLSGFRRPSDRFITVGNPLFTVNPSLQNFAPRMGFAWDPLGDGKMSIRGGYGLFYELIQPVHYCCNVGGVNPPFAVRLLRVPNPPFPDPKAGLDLDRVIPTPWVISDEILQGGIHQYQLSIQRELVADLVLQVAYSGSHGYNLGHMTDRNTAIPQRDAQGRFPFWPADAVRRNPAFTQMRDFAWDGTSWYNSLGITAKKRFSQGYSFQVSYTYGRSIDTTSSTGVFDDGGTPNGAVMFPDDISIDKGLSAFDVRNRLVINGTWDLPFGSGRAVGAGWSGPVQQILGGWTINGILTASDGGHANLLLPFNWSRNQQTTDVSDRPNLVSGGNNNPVLSDGREPERYFDPFQFELGPTGYLGTLGRNTLENPGVLALDLSLVKRFNFNEQRSLQFRAEMFNIANRANFGTPTTATFISPTLRNPTAGRITRTITTSRQIQFALKFYF